MRSEENNPNLAGERLLAAFDQIGLQDIASNPDNYLGHLEGMPFEEWDGYCAMINGEYRGIPVSERGANAVGRIVVMTNSDGYSSEDVIYLAPSPIDGNRLLTEAYDTANQIPSMDARSLLMRLAVYYTHRYVDGNTRGAAIHYALGVYGYDASQGARNMYANLAVGRKGVQDENLAIDSLVLPKRYAKNATATSTAEYGYDGPIPAAVENVDIDSLCNMRVDLPLKVGLHTMLAASSLHIGVAATVRYLLEQGKDLRDFVREQDDGAYRLRLPKLLGALSLDDCQEMLDTHDGMVSEFISGITDCFNGDTRIFGDWREIPDLIHPAQMAKKS